MCGITGLWAGRSISLDELRAHAVAMRDSLRHRGPDDAGVVVEESSGLALAQRRLSILDLSPEGHQPMPSASGRWLVVFNGEIYNHHSLRERLPHVRWRGTSDTETLCSALDEWGLDGAVERSIGMFAIAAWDRQERELHLVRDRLGIKPLAWGHTADGSLVFGSELHALRAHPAFDRALDEEAVVAYFDVHCVPAPRTIHRSASKLLPGTIATFSSAGETPRVRRFWSAEDVLDHGALEPSRADEHESLDELDNLLRDAVRMRLLADVPVGAFLSGGIDSSLVVALAQEVSPTSIHTFSIGSTDPAFDESGFAERVAAHLGTTHTAFRVTEAEAVEVIPWMSRIFDEPFGDSSQVPTYLVSRLARGHVTVALSGDGGDEVFGGYNRHIWAPRIAAMQALPRVARRGGAALLESVSAATWDRLHAVLSPPLPKARLLGDKLHKTAWALRTDSLDEMHSVLRGHWPVPPVAPDLVRSARSEARHRGMPPALTLMTRDLVEYLPDDVLTKVDRASMAVSLEARVPVLDHRVVELAARLPMRLKIRDGRGKWALRELLARRVPRALFERPKTGFSMPIGAWLRGPLRDWAESLLDANALSSAGIDARRVRAAWKHHVAGRTDAGVALWDVLAFRAWHEAHGARTAPRARSAELSR